MNTVTKVPPKSKYVWTGNANDLIGDNFENVKSAFFGDIGSEYNQLFLVSYGCIIKANRPDYTWLGSTCNVKVIRFVDVNITVIGDYDE